MKRQISTRVSDFKQLIEEGSLYVDKTKYVYEMVKQKGNDYFFISRPRRYGKSLFCSTLEHLFKGERELFKGLYIAEETDYSFEKHPVLHFNFSLLNTSSFESFLFGFEDMIAEKAIESGIELERNLPSYMLMEFLRRSEKASVIIIDEFDSPIIDSLNDKGKLERIRSEFSSFYSVMKNTGSLGDEEHREQGALLIHNRGDEALEHVDILEDEQPYGRIYAGRVRVCIWIH